MTEHIRLKMAAAKSRSLSDLSVNVGGDPGPMNEMEYVVMSTAGNAIDFGNLTTGRKVAMSGFCSESRGIAGGGVTSGETITIDYWSMVALGDATDFGDLTVIGHSGGGYASDTRGIWYGGASRPTTIDYITIASTGNATDFGDTIDDMQSQSDSGDSNGTRGVSGGGACPTECNTNEYTTIASTGNGTDFGNLVVARTDPAATAGGGRMVQWGGQADAPNNADLSMDYITIASAGNSTNFGESLVACKSGGGSSNGTRGIFTSGTNTSGTIHNVIEYITIASTGNATDFGDSLQAKRQSVGAGYNL